LKDRQNLTFIHGNASLPCFTLRVNDMESLHDDNFLYLGQNFEISGKKYSLDFNLVKMDTDLDPDPAN
jgi:hypothetical protein